MTWLLCWFNHDSGLPSNRRPDYFLRKNLFKIIGESIYCRQAEQSRSFNYFCSNPDLMLCTGSDWLASLLMVMTWLLCWFNHDFRLPTNLNRRPVDFLHWNLSKSIEKSIYCRQAKQSKVLHFHLHQTRSDVMYRIWLAFEAAFAFDLITLLI